MSKTSITFEHACEQIEKASAIILDESALSYPEIDDDNKEIIINYSDDDGDQVSYVFDETDEYMINDGAIIIKKPNESFRIDLLTMVKAV